MKTFEIGVPGYTPRVVQAHYWTIENGVLTFSNMVERDEFPDVAAFSTWDYVTEIPGA